jgi:hypothetical protein
MRSRLQSVLVAHGALVFLVGMVAGFPFALLVQHGLETSPPGTSPLPPVPGDVRGWRMAHLEGILNGVLLIAVGAVLPRLSLSARAQTVLAWSLLVTAWGNMVASVIGPLFGGRGLALGGGIANDLMFVLFTVAVVTVIVAMALVARGAFRAAAIEGGAGRVPDAEA